MIYLILIGSIQLPPGAPDLSLFGIPVLAGRLVFAVIWQARPGAAGRVGGKSRRAAATQPPAPRGPGARPAPSCPPARPGASAHSEKVTRAQPPSSSGGRALEFVRLQMALGLLRIFFSGGENASCSEPA